jgi:hypothetical protein
MKNNINKTSSFIVGLITLGSTLVTLGLAGCGSDNTPPYVKKLNRNVRSVSAGDVLTVFAQDDYPAPVQGKTISQPARFKVVYNLYEDQEDRILIPSGTIVSGAYFNDGKTCRVDWKHVYAHGDETMDKHNAVKLSHVANPTICNPEVGIKSGEPLVINFTRLP